MSAPVRVRSNPALSSLIDSLRLPDGGFTVQPFLGHRPTDGYAVSVFPEAERVYPSVSPHALAAYLHHWSVLLHEPDNFLGGWHNPESHLIHLDISRVVHTRIEALLLAQMHHQAAYFDIAAGQSVYV
jgi:hypothetical protein